MENHPVRVICLDLPSSLMPKKNPLIDNYLKDGCGRCPLGGTPECKVNPWRPILTKLRKALLDCGLTEELKWKVPCYTFDSKNIVILSAFKEYCSISFFKGSLLKDTHNILVAPGENSQATRQMRVTTARRSPKSCRSSLLIFKRRST